MEKSGPLRIIWHHVGREHGGANGYAPELRVNSPEIVEAYLSQKEAQPSENYWFRHDETTLVELPLERADRRWIIIYLLDLNLQLSLGYKRHSWWLADIVSFGKTKSGAIIVRDLLLDVEVDRDLQYRVLDEDELAEAVQKGIVPLEEAQTAMGALSAFIRMVEAKSFPDPRIGQLIDLYWPSDQHPPLDLADKEYFFSSR